MSRAFTRGRRLLLFQGLAIPLLSHCTSAPSIERETATVPLSQIVERVKCEVWLATQEPLSDPKFRFLNSWDATVDLTLIVNDQAGVNPGVSVINPLKTVTLASKGTFSQSFSLGLGGSVTGQAILTDTVSFSLALRELNSADKGLVLESIRNTYYNRCLPFQEGDLIGNLHLKEWVKASLIPVYNRETGYPLLTAGVHPSVGGGGSKGTLKKISNDAYRELVSLKTDRSAELTVAPNQTDDNKATPKPPSVLDLAIQTVTVLPNNPEALDRFVTDNAPALKADPKVKTVVDNLARKIAEQKNAPRTPSHVSLNDPLDTISHQVQFIVTWTANATPGWSLFDIRGPNPASGSLLSGQHITTHQLVITMGPTGSKTQKTPNSDVQAARQTQQFNGALQRLQIAPLQ